MKRRLHLLCLLGIDLAMVAMEWPIIAPEWQSSGVWMLRFYTQSSNVLAMFVCAVCAVCEIGCLIKAREMPRWAQMLRYIATCCLMVTLLVSALILVPMSPGESYRSFMFTGVLLYVHTLCPLTMLLGYLVSGGAPMKAKHALLAVVPTVIYGVISLWMNAMRVYTGPYFFFHIYRQSLAETAMWFVGLIGGNFLIAWALGKMQSKLRARRPDSIIAQ